MGSVLLLSGCGKKELLIPYETHSSISADRIYSERTQASIQPFATNIAVIEGDKTEGEVDMSGAAAAGLFDVNNKNTLYAKSVHAPLEPASLTKVLTALIALKEGNKEDVLTASENVQIQESGATLCGFLPGDQITLEQALHGLLMKSGNDAAVMIAEYNAGSVEAFAEKMNKEALRLGATNSHFTNPHGLSDPNHYTTVYDMYLIFLEAIQNNEFNEIIQRTEYKSVYKNQKGEDKEMSFKTTNLYLQGEESPPGNITVMGGKTGTTRAAGSCLVLLSKNTGGNPFISVILKAENGETLYAEMTDLLEEIPN